jgi:nicotinate-nucleotide--dimethylbenzimidazole phosphoribosyltransferase
LFDLNDTFPSPDLAFSDAARAHQACLTKPQGSLGELESLAVTLAGLQRRAHPAVDRLHIAIFAADHGVAADGVSAFPQAVTAQMIRNFANGGAAISVLARELSAKLEIINLGTVSDVSDVAGVVQRIIAPSTAHLSQRDAMTRAQLEQAMAAGTESVGRAVDAGAELYIGGDMGIGNTTAAAAIACALLRLPPVAIAGPGTGLDAAGMARKVALLDQALEHHRDHLDDPEQVLRRLGGFEIAALAGAYIAAARAGLPVLVDGFITTAAALAATHMQPATRPWLLFAHRSAEPGHRAMIEALQARPLLDLGMRLGEGSGAAVAVPLMRMACALHSRMATFAEAGVANAGGSN